jgi:hypothetical protein
MTINGTDFYIQQKGAARQGNLFSSHDYMGMSAFCYKLGVDIFAGDSVWVKRPYPAGAWNGIIFFTSVLSYCLEPGEHVEANNGYVGYANKIKCSNNNCNPVENLGMQGMARSHHETLNGCHKNWGSLEKVYYHDIMLHGTVFYACAVITQLAIVNGKPLFEVEYGDE